MKKKAYSIGILFGLAVLLFYGAYSLNNKKMFGANVALRNIAGLNSEEAIETFAAKLAEIPTSKAEELIAKIREGKVEEEKAETKDDVSAWTDIYFAKEQEEESVISEDWTNRNKLAWKNIITADMELFDASYKTTSEEGERSVNIKYPYFSETSYPKEICGKINALLEEDIKYHCNEKYGISCDYDLEGHVTYLDEDYISVLYQGIVYPATSAWNFAWGTTIDMRTCTVAGIEEVTELPGMLEKLEHREFGQKGGINIDWYEEEWLPPYLKAPINWKEEYEGLSMDSSDINHFHDFYLKNDKAGILLEVPSALGSYIVVEIDR